MHSNHWHSNHSKLQTNRLELRKLTRSQEQSAHILGDPRHRGDQHGYNTGVKGERLAALAAEELGQHRVHLAGQNMYTDNVTHFQIDYGKIFKSKVKRPFHTCGCLHP